MTKRLTAGLNFRKALLELARLEPRWQKIAPWLNNLGVVNCVPGFIVRGSQVAIPVINLVKTLDLVVFDRADPQLLVYSFAWLTTLQDRVHFGIYTEDELVRCAIDLNNKKTHPKVAEALQAIMKYTTEAGF